MDTVLFFRKATVPVIKTIQKSSCFLIVSITLPFRILFVRDNFLKGHCQPENPFFVRKVFSGLTSFLSRFSCMLFETSIKYGFERYISAITALKVFEITSCFCSFSPCYDQNLHFQNCYASEMQQIACSREFLLCRYTAVYQREKFTNVREILYFRHMELLFQKACEYCSVHQIVFQ